MQKQIQQSQCANDSISSVCANYEHCREYLVFSATFMVSFVVYFKTAPSSIVGGDAGELVAEGCKLGTSHPPGYPLYTALIFLVTQLRLQFPSAQMFSPAYCANILSCILGSLTSALIASNVYCLSSGIKPIVCPWTQVSCSVTAGLLHTLSPLSWQYSITAEVFALHNFFVSWILTATIQCAKERRIYNIRKGAFLCGFSLSNQHTSILLEIPVVFWILTCVVQIHKRTKFVNKILLQSTLFFCLGLTPYLCLPYLADKYPHPGSWGEVTTLNGFLHHLQRKDYGTFQLYSGKDDGAEGLLQRVFLYFQDLALIQAGLIFFLFICYGAFIMCYDYKFIRVSKKKLQKFEQKHWNTSGVGRCIVLSLLFYLIGFHSLANLPLQDKLLYGIHQRFWMHPNVLSFTVGGVGLFHFCNSFAYFLIQRNDHIRSYFAVIIPPIQMALVISILCKSFEQNDQSNNLVFHNYAKSILESVPPNSLLLINYDQQWTSIRYFQECENMRSDVTSIHLSMMSYKWWRSKHHLYPKINFPAHRYGRDDNCFSFSEFVDANYENFRGKIFIGGRLNFPETLYDKYFIEIPHGMMRQIRRGDDDLNLNEYYLQSLKAWKIVAKYNANQLPSASRYPQETWEWTVQREFFDHLVSRATHLLDLALSLEKKSFSKSESQKNLTTLDAVVEAIAWLELVLGKDKSSLQNPSLKKNLGLAYMHVVRNKEEHGKNNPPLLRNIFGSNFTKIGTKTHPLWRKTKQWKENEHWKTWASSKWKDSWSDFLEMEEAMRDPDYKKIRQIYDQVMISTQKR